MPCAPAHRACCATVMPSSSLILSKQAFAKTKKKIKRLMWFCQPANAASLPLSNPQCIFSQVCLLSLPLQLLQPLVCKQEVVFKVEVGEVLAVEQVRGQLLQAAAGQIDGIDPLGHHLDGRRGRRDGGGGGASCRRKTKRGKRNLESEEDYPRYTRLCWWCSALQRRGQMSRAGQSS